MTRRFREMDIELYDRMEDLATDLLHTHCNVLLMRKNHFELYDLIKNYAKLDDDNPLMKRAIECSFVIPGEDVSFEEVFDELDRIQDINQKAWGLVNNCTETEQRLNDLATKGYYHFPSHQDIDEFHKECAACVETSEKLLEEKRIFHIYNNLEGLLKYATGLVKDVKKWEG